MSTAMARSLFWASRGTLMANLSLRSLRNRLGQRSGMSPDGPPDSGGISSGWGSECGREEALDHGVHLLGNLELVKVPGSDSDPHLQVRLDCTQPDGVGIRVQS